MAAFTLAACLSVVLTGVFTFFAYSLASYLARLLRIRAIVMKQWPGLPPHWLTGNIKQHPMSDPRVRSEDSERGLTFLLDLTAKYPHGFRWFQGFFSIGVVANHPDIMRAVMRGRDPKPMMRMVPGYRFALAWLGRGLLLAEGDTWFRNRRLITHAFHFDVLRTYMKLYNSATEILMSKMRVCATRGESFVVTKNVSLCTLDILLNCAFSYDTNCQTKGESHPYVVAVNELANDTQVRAFTPLLHLDFIFDKSSVGRRFHKNVKFVHSISDDMIKKRRQEMTSKSEQSEPENSKPFLDFLGILLAARDEDGRGMTDLEIRNEVDTFLFEGHDTTASSLTWMLYAMALYPEHQRRVQAEIDEVLAGRDSDEILWGDLGKFKYLGQCLKEAMRIYPPVPVIKRVIAEKDIVVKGRLIPKGAVVELNIHALHHNPEVWPNPSVYDPDRFSPENVQKIDPYAFVPFSAGPRNCIGQNFALNEEKVVLARVLRTFHVELDPEHKVVAAQQLVLRAANDIKLKCRQRQNSE